MCTDLRMRARCWPRRIARPCRYCSRWAARGNTRTSCAGRRRDQAVRRPSGEESHTKNTPGCLYMKSWSGLCGEKATFSALIKNSLSVRTRGEHSVCARYFFNREKEKKKTTQPPSLSTYVIVFTTGVRLQRRNPFLHFSPRLCA